MPAQLKSAAVEACRYEPGIERTYEELAAHYGTTIIRRARAHRATRLIDGPTGDRSQFSRPCPQESAIKRKNYCLRIRPTTA